jgi:hypothetical protein
MFFLCGLVQRTLRNLTLLRDKHPGSIHIAGYSDQINNYQLLREELLDHSADVSGFIEHEERIQKLVLCKPPLQAAAYSCKMREVLTAVATEVGSIFSHFEPHGLPLVVCYVVALVVISCSRYLCVVLATRDNQNENRFTVSRLRRMGQPCARRFKNSAFLGNRQCTASPRIQ